MAAAKVTIVFAIIGVALGANKPLTAFGNNKGVFVWSSLGSVARFQISVYEAPRISDKWKLLGNLAQGKWDKLDGEIHAFRDNTQNQTAFAKPVNFKQIWNCQGDSTWLKGSFWRMECPEGYVSVGDVVYPSNKLTAPPAVLFKKFRCLRADLTERCRGWGYKIWDNGNSIARFSASVWPPTPETTAFSEFFYTHTELDATPKVQPYCIKKKVFNIL